MNNLNQKSIYTHLPYLIIVVFMSIIIYRIDAQNTQIAQYVISQQNQINLFQKDVSIEFQSFALKNQVVDLMIQQESMKQNLKNVQEELKVQVFTAQRSQDKIEELNKHFEGISTSIRYLNNTFDTLPSLISKVDVLSLNIEYYKQSIDQQVQKIQNSTNDIIQQFQLQKTQMNDFQISTSQNLTKALEAQQTQLNEQISKLSTKLEVNTQLGDISQSINEIKSVSSEIPTLKNQLGLVFDKVSSDTFNLIEIFGPFYPSSYIQLISQKTSQFEIFNTTKPTSFLIKAKAIVTLIATGHTLCSNSCDSLITFLVDRQENLPQSDLGWKFGMGLATTNWTNLFLTQEFIVEKGIHEFSLGVLYKSGTVHLHGISFVMKVTYIA